MICIVCPIMDTCVDAPLCVYIYTCIYMCIYIYTYTYTHMCISLSLYIYIYTYICAYIYAYTLRPLDPGDRVHRAGRADLQGHHARAIYTYTCTYMCISLSLYYIYTHIR